MPDSSLWVSCPKRRTRPALRVYCFPYAGGGTGIYRRWPLELPESIELWTVHLPGREKRISEPPIDSIPTLVGALAEGLRPSLGKPFGFFGHSMGALVAFELSRYLVKTGCSGPRCLVVSSFAGPDRPIRHRINHLPEPEFVAELKKLGGTPFEVLEHAQLVQLLLPTLRADHRAVEEYKYCAGTPLTCPIYVYGGADDLYVPKDDLEAWKTCTCAPVTIRLFRGDHFYIHSNSHVMIQLGRDLLADAVPSSAS